MKARVLVVLGVVGLAIAATACNLPMAASGAACPKPGDFAQDGTHVMKCENGVWTNGITVAAGDAALEMLKAKMAQPAPAPSKPARDSWANCTEVRDAGAAPIMRGERGYAPKLDRDNDGIACEVE